jgi:ABC-type sugar transport system substrate-binding protein
MRILFFAASAVGALVVGVSGYVAALDKPVIATVVKISGIPWFNRMEVGVKAFQDANPDVIASESGPATANAAKQLQIVEDLIARGVNALAVVPMDPAVIEGAREPSLMIAPAQDPELRPLSSRSGNFWNGPSTDCPTACAPYS